MSEIELQNKILIRRDREDVYHYVTQPRLWHQWHPSSLAASSHPTALSVNDQFMEEGCLKPIPWLPWKIRRQLHYRVVEVNPPHSWAVRATSPNVELTIRYQLSGEKETLFSRHLSYSTSGWMRWIEPWILRQKMEKQSAEALENLKAMLENQSR